MSINPPAESIEQKIRRILGNVEEVQKTDGTITYLDPNSLREGRLFRFVKRSIKKIDERDTGVWEMIDIDTQESCQIIESAQLSKHLPLLGQILYLRFNGTIELDGGRRVNDFTLNVYTVK
jgi:hypothetical protein